MSEGTKIITVRNLIDISLSTVQSAKWYENYVRVAVISVILDNNLLCAACNLTSDKIFDFFSYWQYYLE